MATTMSSSCYVSSLLLIPFKHSFTSSIHSPVKTLISRPTLSFRRTIVTFQKISTGVVPPISSASSSSPSISGYDSEEEEDYLPPKLQEIIKLFQSVQEPRAKYEQLLFYGKNLKPLDSQFKTRENKVQGCVSQVWVRAFFDEERNVVYEADSDSVLTKGLAALLVQGLSGSPVPEILRVKPDFVVLLGLQQSLSASRNNGFLNMLILMQKKALHLEINSQEEDSESSFESTPETIANVESDSDSEPSLVEDLEAEENEEFDGDSTVVALGSRGMRIREKLETELSPVELEVDNVSSQHAGHAGVSGGNDGETHFNLRIVSDAFQGKSSIKRHRMIHELLQEELQSGLHALSIVAKTPAEV